MLNGMDLFSGYGGISLALEPWVRPVLYCESESYPQQVLLSRMSEGELPKAPIWDDVRTLPGWEFRGLVDIIYGGFPCQDISTAGNGAGLEGERSGLFFQIVRLAQEVKPKFLFLENVPAIRTRGQREVGKKLASLGYDCRWGVVSAREVGAPHLRKRWFLLAADSDRLGLRNGWQWGQEGQAKTNHQLAHNGQARPVSPFADTNKDGCFKQEVSVSTEFKKESIDLGGSDRTVAHTDIQRLETRASDQISQSTTEEPERCGGCQNLANSNSEGFWGEASSSEKEDNQREWEGYWRSKASTFECSWWGVEPNVGRVVDGSSFRLDHIEAADGLLFDKKRNQFLTSEEVKEVFRKKFRSAQIEALGNGVVPLQVRVAWMRLMGLGL